MVTYEDRNRLQHSWTWWRWTLIGLNALALVLSAALSWHYIKGGSMVGCNGGSSCDMVLSSRWSLIARVLPVSALAVGVYFAMLVAGFFIGPTTEVSVRRLAWRAMLILAGSVTGSAVWFTYVQKWVIGDFCIYCMSTHITGLLLAALVVWRATKEFDNHSNNISATNPAMRLFLIGLVLASVLAVSQISFTSPSVYSNGKSQDNLPSINYRSVPMIGSPDAPFVVNLLFDYECPHCQKLHLMLDEAIRRYGGKLAFVLCPTPLNTKCNPYITRDVDEFKNSCELAKIGLAVWVAKRKAFHDFDNWMYTFESGDRWRPRSLESARSKAIALVGKVKYDAALDDPWIGRYMQTCIRVYGQTIQNGNGGVPKLIFGAHWVIPEPNNADDLVRILQKSLGIPQP